MRKLLLITGLLQAAMGCQNEKGETLPEGRVASPDGSTDRPTPAPANTDDKSPVPILERIKIESYADLGPRSQTRIEDGVIVTEGVIRVRRRHENDMDFSKYNPFYWEGRLAFFKVEDFTARGEKSCAFIWKRNGRRISFLRVDRIFLRFIPAIPWERWRRFGVNLPSIKGWSMSGIGGALW